MEWNLFSNEKLLLLFWQHFPEQLHFYKQTLSYEGSLTQTIFKSLVLAVSQNTCRHLLQTLFSRNGGLYTLNVFLGVKPCFHWRSLLANRHKYVQPTCHAHLGWHDTNRNDPVCVASSKVAIPSKADIFVARNCWQFPQQTWPMYEP